MSDGISEALLQSMKLNNELVADRKELREENLRLRAEKERGTKLIKFLEKKRTGCSCPILYGPCSYCDAIQEYKG